MIINYLLEHLPYFIMVVLFTLAKVFKSWLFQLIIEVMKELFISYIVDLIKKYFKKKEE